METVVGIAEYALTDTAEDVLITYSLGSCVGLVLYDPSVRVAGLLHAMLPLAASNPEKAAENPAMFTDAGATALIQAMFDRGATRATIEARVAGAAAQLDRDGIFRIGERNYAVLRKVLWKNGILISAEDVGGNTSRTVTVDAATGTTLVKSAGSVRQL